MAQKTETLLETLSQTFPGLSDENKSFVLDMTNFLVVTQNVVVPAMLHNRAPDNRRRKT